VPQRLLSTTSLLQTYSDETISLTNIVMKLSGSKDGKIGSIEAHVDPLNNLPTTLMFNLDETNQAVKDFANMTTTVSEANNNLSDAEKELLKWHQRLGHIDFRKIKFLFRTGILSYGDVSRRLHTAASKIVNSVNEVYQLQLRQK
jgi:hypothetical protein